LFRYEAERTSELPRSERELRDVVDTHPGNSVECPRDGSNAYVDSTFLEYSGMSAEQAKSHGELPKTNALPLVFRKMRGRSPMNTLPGS